MDEQRKIENSTNKQRREAEREELYEEDKQRWDIEFPRKKRTMQNLVDNARRFEKKILRPGGGANIQAQKHID